MRAIAWTSAVSLAACASVPQTGALSGAALSGRLAVRVEASDAAPARSVNATFELIGGPETGRLNLSTPLGSVLAQARWSPGSVVLGTPQGDTRFADLDALTSEVLGESVPVAALFDWLNGRPWAGAPSRASTPPAQPGFEQLGWLVDVSRSADGVIAARRLQPPAVTVRVRLDQP